MEKQADLIRPKFELVEKIFSDELASRGIGTWMHPLGGYFISFEAPEGCAKEIVSKCKEAGVVLTGAGSRSLTKRSEGFCHPYCTDVSVACRT